MIIEILILLTVFCVAFLLGSLNQRRVDRQKIVNTELRSGSSRESSRKQSSKYLG